MPGQHSAGSRARTSIQEVTETLRGGRIPLRAHPGWTRDFPWIVQGTTARRRVAPKPGHDDVGRDPTGLGPSGSAADDLDFGLFTGAPSGDVMNRWELLAKDTGCGRVVHSRQVHGGRVVAHGTTPPGLLLAPPCDGHATRIPATLLAVSVADCVPVFVVAPGTRTVMLLHAGWRGVASGILEAGLAMLERDSGIHPREAHIHMGPAICGLCYEVGREVHEALGLPPAADRARPVDLRRVLAGRALASGADRARLTISTFCTRCSKTPFFSHRGGDAGRQIAVLGISPEGPAAEMPSATRGAGPAPEPDPVNRFRTIP